MATQGSASPSTSDVLHAEHPTRLSEQEIAKAVARHQRQHPTHSGMSRGPKIQKTIPRG